MEKYYYFFYITFLSLVVLAYIFHGRLPNDRNNDKKN